MTGREEKLLLNNRFLNLALVFRAMNSLIVEMTMSLPNEDEHKRRKGWKFQIRRDLSNKEMLILLELKLLTILEDGRIGIQTPVV